MFWAMGFWAFGCLFVGCRKGGLEVVGGLGVFGVLGLIWGSGGFGVSDFEFLDFGFRILRFW